jgi:peptide/nickel transport system substrate-binding protein
MSSGTGSEAMLGDIAQSRRLFAEAGYNGEKIVFLAATDNPTLSALSAVTADLMRKLGLNFDMRESDWATLLQRRASQEPVERGGWSLFHTTAAAWAGWPTDPRMEELRRAWIFAADEAEQRRLGVEIERQAFASVPYIPLGQFVLPTAYRKSLSDIVDAYAPFFWGMNKA